MTIEEWSSNINEYLESINVELLQNENAKKLYYGFEVFDGTLKINPKILFVGINPGKGDGTQHYQIKFSSNEISYLHRFDDDKYPYPLADTTIGIFRQIGFSDEQIKQVLKKDCVKTNLYHIITQEEKDIKNCLNLLGKNKSDAFWKKSCNFCKDLIETIKPNVVIFEGKGVYNSYIEEFASVKGTWSKEFDFGYYQSPKTNVHFLGYSRLFSTMLSNKEAFAKKLHEIIK